jgi:hypothetical protein
MQALSASQIIRYLSIFASRPGGIWIGPKNSTHARHGSGLFLDIRLVVRIENFLMEK